MAKIKDLNLKFQGRKQIEWAAAHMPILRMLRESFSKTKPFVGLRIGACLHVTSETANLLLLLKESGADIYLCASNPLSTQDEVAAALVDCGIEVFACRGEDTAQYYQHIESVVATKPHLTIDDGGDLTVTMNRSNTINTFGGTEETTTGVTRLRQMEADGKLRYPIIAVNDSKTKYLFDNRYGTGQSTIDGILRLTHILLSGKVVVVCGYGWCGRGIALRAHGMGADVIVTEINPIRALEARLDGYRVMRMDEAAQLGDIFITATGNCKVITIEHIKRMRDGAILCNAGHFDVEVDIESIKREATNVAKLREGVVEYRFSWGNSVRVLCDGRLVNLAGAEGHPPEVMDMSFANQALAVKFLVENKGGLQNQVYKLPDEIDHEVARLKLNAMGIDIDTLTDQQKQYLQSWQFGT